MRAGRLHWRPPSPWCNSNALGWHLLLTHLVDMIRIDSKIRAIRHTQINKHTRTQTKHNIDMISISLWCIEYAYARAHAHRETDAARNPLAHTQTKPDQNAHRSHRYVLSPAFAYTWVHAGGRPPMRHTLWRSHFAPLVLNFIRHSMRTRVKSECVCVCVCWCVCQWMDVIYVGEKRTRVTSCLCCEMYKCLFIYAASGGGWTCAVCLIVWAHFVWLLDALKCSHSHRPATLNDKVVCTSLSRTTKTTSVY